jgi:hypothetical protein
MNESSNLDHEIVFKDSKEDGLVFLYGVENFGSFVKYFSLASFYEENKKSVKPPKVKIVFLINNKTHLLKEYLFSNRSIETKLINQLVATIEDIYRDDEKYNLYSSFDIFSFSNNLNYLGNTTTLLSHNYKNETILQEELTTEFKPSCDLPKVLSKLFNEIDSQKRECFIRIVVVTGQTDISYERDHVMNVFKTYIHHYTPVFNFILLETDYMLGNLIQTDLIPYIDFKEGVNQPDKLPDKLKNLQLSVDFEIDISKVATKLINQVNEILNEEILGSFISQFDEAFKEYRELFEYQVSRKQIIKSTSISAIKRGKVELEIKECIKHNGLVWEFCDKVKEVVRSKASDVLAVLIKRLGVVQEFKKDIELVEVSIAQKGSY